MQNINNLRINNLRQTFTENRIDAFLVLIDENRRYLSGFTGEDTGFDESAGALLITADDLVLLTDSRYTLQAERESPGFRVITYKKGLAKELPGLLFSLSIGRLGYEKRKMTCEQFEILSGELEKSESNPAPDLVGLVDTVEKQRIIKSDDEIQAIRKALLLAENAFTGMLGILAPGMPETAAAWELEKRMREAGAGSVSFPVIAAAGVNAALPHAVPGPDPIPEGKPVLFDWGARVDGYCSDTSRTLVMGKPDERFLDVFNAVYDAREKATEKIRPGAWTLDIDAAAREVLKEKGLDGYFGHGLGHGVGLAIHEKPSLGPSAERNIRLEENMVFTVEPGVYIPEWGGVRLENMVVVRSGGAEVLNTLPDRITV